MSRNKTWPISKRRPGCSADTENSTVLRLSARGRRRFFRSADRPAADPTSDSTAIRHNLDPPGFWLRFQAAQAPVHVRPPRHKSWQTALVYVPHYYTTRTLLLVRWAPVQLRAGLPSPPL